MSSENNSDDLFSESELDKSLQTVPVNSKDFGLLFSAMPVNIKRQFGCMHCEWRGTELCSGKFKRGRPKSIDDRMPHWICIPRAAYLAGFVKSAYNAGLTYNNRISEAQWRQAILSTTAHQQSMKDFFELEQLQNKEADLEDVLTELKKEGRLSEDSVYQQTVTDLTNVREKINRKRFHWHSLIKDLMNFNDKQLTRETPKKIDITSKTINITSLSELFKKAKEDLIVDGEFSEGDEDGTDTTRTEY
jgi:hypothetical protein